MVGIVLYLAVGVSSCFHMKLSLFVFIIFCFKNRPQLMTVIGTGIFIAKQHNLQSAIGHDCST